MMEADGPGSCPPSASSLRPLLINPYQTPPCEQAIADIFRLCRSPVPVLAATLPSALEQQEEYDNEEEEELSTEDHGDGEEDVVGDEGVQEDTEGDAGSDIDMDEELVCAIVGNGLFYCRVRDDGGRSLLHWAALAGNMKVCELLLATAASANTDELLKSVVNTQCTNGQTPLMWAVINNHLPVICLLLKSGADTSLCDTKGATALLVAVQHSRPLVALLLISMGDASMSQRDVHGSDVVQWAAFKGSVTFLRLFDYYGVPFDRKDEAGMTALHRAALGGHYEAAQYILYNSRQLPWGGAYNRDISSQGLTAYDMVKLRQTDNPALLKLLFSDEEDQPYLEHPLAFSRILPPLRFHRLALDATEITKLNIISGQSLELRVVDDREGGKLSQSAFTKKPDACGHNEYSHGSQQTSSWITAPIGRCVPTALVVREQKKSWEQKAAPVVVLVILLLMFLCNTAYVSAAFVGNLSFVQLL
eukprot:GHVQ01001023.1.p2 GENE.GHVQ01001023.1~~GHVQ01001023.1.p2  ORF type:complete len:476 (+),score=81.28 GHVQ01001023.1:4981-6408(+)